MHHLQKKPTSEHRHSFTYFSSCSWLSRKRRAILPNDWKALAKPSRKLSGITPCYSRIDVQSYLNPLKELKQMMTVKAVKEVLSFECPKLYILDCHLLGLPWASILFSMNNLGTHKVYGVHDFLPGKLNFCTGKTILSLKEHWWVRLVICLSSLRHEIQGHL